MDKYDTYEIHKLIHGGYFVRGGSSIENSNMYRPPLFASAELRACFEYIRDRLEPER